MVSLKSFGIPYFEPYTNIINNFRDLKDTTIRLPYRFMKLRPKYLKVGDQVRMNNSRSINSLLDEAGGGREDDGGNDKITKGQSATLIIGSILGAGILTLPSDLSQEANNSGIAMIIIGTILGVIMISIFTKLMEKFESKTIVEIMDEVLPRPITILFEIVFVVFYIASAAGVTRIFADVVKMFLLHDTPLEVIIISLLLSVIFIVRKGIEGIARLVQMVVPIVIIPFGLLFLSLIPQLDFGNIYTIMRFDPGHILTGLKVTLFSFIGMDIVLVSMAYVDNTKKILRYNIITIISLGLIYLIVFIISICQFGIDQTKDLLWPTLFLMKTVDIPGSFLENVEGIVIALWTFIILQTLSVILMQANIILSKSFKLNEMDFLAMPLIPLLYLLALVPGGMRSFYWRSL